MDMDEIGGYLLATFPGVTVDETTPDRFYFYDPERKFPFATIVTRDNEYDPYSHLDREGVFRLNIGVGKAAFVRLFGEPRAKRDGPDDRFDYAALDRLMPHPVYGRMYWVMVLNPGAETLATVRELLAEAYAEDVKRHDLKVARQS